MFKKSKNTMVSKKLQFRKRHSLWYPSTSKFWYYGIFRNHGICLKTLKSKQAIRRRKGMTKVVLSLVCRLSQNNIVSRVLYMHKFQQKFWTSTPHNGCEVFPNSLHYWLIKTYNIIVLAGRTILLIKIYK